MRKIISKLCIYTLYILSFSALIKMMMKIYFVIYDITEKGSDSPLKHHKFWAWAAVICFAMTMYTGHKHR